MVMPKDTKTGIQQLTDIKTTPFIGGCNTVLETQQIPMGRFSMVQNMRETYPGKKQRKGQIKQHTSEDTGNKVVSLYQFVKTRIAEKHFYAQMSDSDVLEATTAPPGTTTGAFGSEVFSGTASPVPASWANLKDTLLFSNGVDQHQIYYGTLSYVEGVIHYNGAAAPTAIPQLGYDYTDQATDGLTSTVVVLDSIDTYANNECLFVCTPVPATGIKFTISATNDTASVASMYYRKSDDTWTQLTNGTHGWTDGTDVAGDTLKQTGTMAWTTQPTDEIPMYMYGRVGYWYQFRFSVQLDSEVEATKVEFTSAWNSIENIWDGVPVPVIETAYYDASVTAYKTFGATSVEIDDATTSDKIYIASADKINGIYIDVGATPNETAATTISDVEYYNGASWSSVGTIKDYTDGFAKTGWVTFPRAANEKKQLNTSQYYAYWYRISIGGATLSSNVIVSLYTQPYFDISKFGKGYCNTAWKGRMVYGTDRDQYMYVSAINRPQVLNGDDFGILEPGDGRSNKPVNAKPFNNELMVWQEEKGKEGGCLTLFEGYSPTTWGKLVLSTKLGTLNAKSVAIVDGVYTSTKTDEVIGKTAFFLSHYGVFRSEGRYVTGISDDIQNYFDPLETSTCIRRGYEDQMWLEHDTAYNVIRIGLVTGSTATTCNTFPVYDLATKAWSFDVFGQDISCMTEVEADTGNVHVLQMVGGADDGFIYQSNNSDDDVSTAINSYVDIELNADGKEFELREMVITVKTGTRMTITPTVDGSSGTPITELSLSDVRNKYSLGSKGMDMKVRVQNNTASESIHLFGFGLKTYVNEAR
jgi:hypothetical protein